MLWVSCYIVAYVVAMCIQSVLNNSVKEVMFLSLSVCLSAGKLRTLSKNFDNFLDGRDVRLTGNGRLDFGGDPALGADPGIF